MKSQSFALSVGVVSRPFARQLAAERIRAARRNAVSKVWALCSKWSNQPPASSLQNVQQLSWKRCAEWQQDATLAPSFCLVFLMILRIS